MHPWTLNGRPWPLHGPLWGLSGPPMGAFKLSMAPLGPNSWLTPMDNENKVLVLKNFENSSQGSPWTPHG